MLPGNTHALQELAQLLAQPAPVIADLPFALTAPTSKAKPAQPRLAFTTPAEELEARR